MAELISSVGGDDDLATLQAALLHDTVEDTDVTLEAIDAAFGAEVRALVAAVTDDKDLPKQERKQQQIEHAAAASPKAQVRFGAAGHEWVKAPRRGQRRPLCL